MQFAQVASISILTQFQDCKTTELFFAIDNRFSDLAFAMGTASNIATQTGTAIFYYYMSSGATDGSIFADLFLATSSYTLYDNIYTFYTAADYQNVGLVLATFFKSIINYNSPNVNTWANSPQSEN